MGTVLENRSRSSATSILYFEQSSTRNIFRKSGKRSLFQNHVELVVDTDLPALDSLIPTAEHFRYNKSSNTIVETKKSEKKRQALYSVVVGQCVLRRLYEVFNSDRDQVVDVMVINAFVDTTDASTGQRVRPCIISVRATRDQFNKLDLRHVEPWACLKGLNAAVSRSSPQS